MTSAEPARGAAELPRGLTDLIVKIAERCNLNCSYCYMYQHVDQSYLDRPTFMSDTTYGHLLDRAAAYCDRRPGHRMEITFHGGEPTLVGPARLRHLARTARARLGDRLLRIVMQTNATLIDDAMLAAILEEDILVSVSIDGPPAIHDSVRVDHAGRGSHDATVRGIRRLQSAGRSVGVLCVVRPGGDGLAAYQHLRSLGIYHVDFLFPDASHDSKPLLYGGYGPTPVADYLRPVFDAWFAEDDPTNEIPLFVSLLNTILGGVPCNDAFGNFAKGYLVIDTDGSIQLLDVLKVCAPGLAESGLHVATHGFDDLAQGSPFVYRAALERIPLCATCEACAERLVCGGGYLPHRYARANGFDNPSVWCADILALIAHIRTKLAEVVPAQLMEAIAARTAVGTAR